MTKISLLFLGWALGLMLSTGQAAERDVTTPIFNSDAKKIAYCVATFDVIEGENGGKKYLIQSSEIWTASSDGRGARRLTSGNTDNSICWSPDGKYLAFVRKNDIWLVGADGTGLKQITKTPALNESVPEFSNDSKILFFVRTGYINLAEFLTKTEPVLKMQPGVVIAHSLVSGEEKERFKSKDSVLQIVPNRADANEVFLVSALDNAPTNATLVVAAAKLDGSGRRVTKEDSKSEIQRLYPNVGGAVIETKEKNEYLETLHRLQIHSKTGNKTVNADEFPLMAFSAISLDGSVVIGSGPITKETNGKFEVVRGLKIYEIATEKFTGLQPDVLLGLAEPTVVPAVAPATPPAKTPTVSPVTPPAPKPAVIPAQPPTPTTPAVPPVQPATPTAATQPTKPAAKLPSLANLAQGRFDAGEASFKKREWRAAIDHYSSAIALSSQFTTAYYKRGLSYRKMQEYDKALEDFNAVIRLAPMNMEAYLERAELHFIQADNELALADYGTAIRLAPQSPKPYDARATFYSAIGDNEKAAQDEKKAKELAPK